MSNIGFKVTALTFKVRDLLKPRVKILAEVGIRPGFHVLDYGSGPGSYTKLLAELVGESGKVYALDINPQAVKMVQRLAAKNLLTNVETILSDRQTDLPDNSIDVVLLYDTFHDLTDPQGVLEELHRILKTDGVLSFSDHHMKEDEIISKVTDKGLFKLKSKGENTYTFSKTIA